jgi:hypothetical protein
MVLRVTGIVRPEREERTLSFDGGVLREEPVPGADSAVDGGTGPRGHWRLVQDHR